MNAQTQTPEMVSLSPANGADSVDSLVAKMIVTFNLAMGGGMSWTGGGEKFPEPDRSRHAVVSDDQKTCTIPVKLKSNQAFPLGLNGQILKNFASKSGVPLSPVVYTFKPM
jgi:hypothetical protein